MKKSLKTSLVMLASLFLLTGCGLSSPDTTAAPASAPVSAPAAVPASGSAVPVSAELDLSVSDRDASGEYSAKKAVSLSPEDELTITEAGVYLLSGSYENRMIVIDAGKDDKVQLVLSNASVTNDDGPAIFVRSADKVFLTAAAGTVNTISDGADYSLKEDGTKLDAAVFSKDDLTINGAGSLTINGNCKHAVVSKDDLVITAKDLHVNAAKVGLNGKDSVKLSDAAVSISVGNDGIRSDEYVAVMSGTLDITAREGIEASYVLICGGEITIRASDDGINAANKSENFTPTVEIRGGTLSITMGAGDTDGIDSNGDIIISGGTVYVYGSSTFDYGGSASFTGGEVYVNGQQVTELPNQFMGGMPGGMGGGPGGPGTPGAFGGGPGGQGGGPGGRPGGMPGGRR